MDTAAVSSLQRQVLIWNYFETYEADRVRETLRPLPSTFSGPQEYVASLGPLLLAECAALLLLRGGRSAEQLPPRAAVTSGTEQDGDFMLVHLTMNDGASIDFLDDDCVLLSSRHPEEEGAGSQPHALGWAVHREGHDGLLLRLCLVAPHAVQASRTRGGGAAPGAAELLVRPARRQHVDDCAGVGRAASYRTHSPAAHPPQRPATCGAGREEAAGGAAGGAGHPASAVQRWPAGGSDSRPGGQRTSGPGAGASRHRQNEDDPGAAQRIGVRRAIRQPAVVARGVWRRRCIDDSGGGTPNEACACGSRLALARPQHPQPQDSPEHASASSPETDAAESGVQQLSIGEAQPSAPAADAAAAAPAQSEPEASAGPEREASNGTPSADAQPSAASAAPAVDVSNPDAVAVHCLLAGCHSVDDGELPIMTSDFQSRHMLPNLPEGATLDLKKTSFKKLAKLLSVHEKKGLLSQKLVRKQDHIAGINRSHALYTAFAPAEQSAAPAAAAAGGKANGAAREQLASITVTAAYKGSSSLQPVLGAAARDKLYSEAEAEAALRRYAADNGLAASADADEMALDRLLISALYNKSEQPAEGATEQTAEVLRRLLGKLQIWSRVIRKTQHEEMETMQKGGPDKHRVLVQLEDRAGGRKHITRLSGMEAFSIDPEELAGALQRRFQSSASVTKLPGKTETGKEIALQGDQLHNAAQYLTEVYGLPPAFVTSKNRSKG